VNNGCDVAETCNGTGAACPANIGRSNGTVCRASAGNGCDVAETCNGSASACPANNGVANGTVCRAAVANGCDVAETCNGTGAACPANLGLPNGTVCRASTTPLNQACDPQEVCNGTGAACPGNTVIRTPTTETCNSVDDDCDGVVDDNSASTCAAPINIGSIAVGGSATRTEWISAVSGAEQWYVVTFPQNADFSQHGTGTPQIQLTAGASVRFDVQSSCGVNMPCGSGGSGTGLTTWSFSDTISTSSAYLSRSVAWPTTVYIRVYRISAPTTCANQTLVVSRPAGSSFTAGFTTGVAPSGQTTCGLWNTFRAGINPSTVYSTITLSGSNNPTGRSCTGAAANTLCQALRTGVSAYVSCNGFNWAVDTCAGIELVTDAAGGLGASGCTCSSNSTPAYSVRPCHTDGNWGGIAASSLCGQATQTISVTCL
jgi:hypothetical protein